MGLPLVSLVIRLSRFRSFMMLRLPTEALVWKLRPVLVKVIWVRCTYATFLIQTAIKFAAFIGLAEPKHNGSHTAYGPDMFLLEFVATRGY